MFIDLRDLEGGSVFDADVCIVGAGAAGIALALSLRDSGLAVCLVEGGGLPGEPDGHALYAGHSIGHDMQTDVGRHRGLGGTTGYWSGRCTPFSPIDFARRSWIEASGWPIALADLGPYYDQAWSICGIRDPIGADADTIAELTAGKPAHGSDDVDLFLWRFSSTGDIARMHLGNAFTDELRDSDTVRVLLHANLHRLEASPDGRTVTGVAVKSLAGTDARVRARAVVLSAGGLENARILLNGADTAPGGFGNRHDLVGRYFMQHPRCTAATIEASPAAAARLQDTYNFFPTRHGPRYEIGFVLSEAVQRREHLLNVKAVIIYEHAERSGWDAIKTVTQDLRARRIGLGTLRAAATLLASPKEVLGGIWRRRRGRPAILYGGRITISMDLEQVPDRESRVTLADGVDSLGLRQLAVDWRIGPLETRTARRMAEAIGAEIARLGLGTVRLEPWLLEGGTEGFIATHHHIGATRMARSPSHGVVDPDCKVFDTTNLYVAGSSVFPTGGHANPTLTIVALAIRLARHLESKLAAAHPVEAHVTGSVVEPSQAV